MSLELDAPEDLDDFNAWAMERGWGDGLTLVPPTEDRVQRMVEASGQDPDSVLGHLPPSHAPLTIEKVAINAVMAGCRPEYMPVVTTAVAAMADASFNAVPTLYPCGMMVMVNGPIARELNIECGAGLFGPGFRANATIGRAVRLVLINLAGARPGLTDLSLGSPARFSFCFAENEDASPWTPYHVDLGFDRGESTVTVAKVEGPHNINDHVSNAPDGIMITMAQTIATMGQNLAYVRYSDYFVGFYPEHARIVAGAGWTKRDVQVCLYERARIPYKFWRQGGLAPAKTAGGQWYPQPRFLYPGDDDFGVPLGISPDDVRVIVVGGPTGHSVWMPPEGLCRSVTRAIPKTPKVRM